LRKIGLIEVIEVGRISVLHFLFLICFSSLLRSAVPKMEGGNYDITDDILADGGRVSRTGGNYSLSDNLGGFSVSNTSGGNYTLSSGFMPFSASADSASSLIPPTNFRAFQIWTSSITWYWTDNEGGSADGYRILNSTDGIVKDSLSPSATSWTETGLFPDTQFTRYAEVYRGTMTAVSVSTTVYTAASIPSGLSSPTQGETTLTLSWSGDGTRYAVERSTDGTIWNYIAQWDNGITAESYADSSLSTGVTYWYRVRAYNGNSLITEPSASISTSTVPGALDAPTGFSGQALSATSILWSWKDNTAGETSYYVAEGITDKSGTLEPDTTFWQENILSPNTEYTRRTVVLKGSDSAYSNTDSKYTLASVPSAASVSNQTNNSLLLIWSGDGTRYLIQRSTDSSVWTNYITWQDAQTDTSLNLSSLPPNTKYYFRIYSYNFNQQLSTGSVSLSASTLANSPASVSVSSVTDHSAALTWSVPGGGASRYGITKTDISASQTEWIVVWDDGLSSATYIAKGLNQNTSYRFHVYAYNVDAVTTTVNIPFSDVTTLTDTTPPQDPTPPQVELPAGQTGIRPGDSINITATIPGGAAEKIVRIIVLVYDQDDNVLAALTRNLAPAAAPVISPAVYRSFSNNLTVDALGNITGTFGILSTFLRDYPAVREIKVGIQVEDDASQRSEIVRTAEAIALSVSEESGGVYNNLYIPSQDNSVSARPSIVYDLLSPSEVSVKIYDLQGRLVRKIADEYKPAGSYVENWDVKNEDGDEAASGVYLLHIKAGSINEVKKIIIVR